MNHRKKNLVLVLGPSIFIGIVSLGVYRAFTRGGNDFNVFYEAWRLILLGKGDVIYRVSPDRFLYSPGFAWGLAGFALVPNRYALALWCLAKIGVLIGISITFSRQLGQRSYFGIALNLLAIGLLARPVLIDFEYGQVNLFIMGICFWALLNHFDHRKSPLADVIGWFLLSFIALGKLFPTVLLFIPWFLTSRIPADKIRRERMGVGLGAVATLLPPLVAFGPKDTVTLFVNWFRALEGKGLPLESHNQSFTAFLHRTFGGRPFHVISEGPQVFLSGWNWLRMDQTALFSLGWTFILFGFVLGWLFSADAYQASRLKWCSIMLSLIFLPSHLIWKPYFVIGIPLVMLILNDWVSRRKPRDILSIAGIFLAVNFSGFDFVGHSLAPYLESASILLFAHLLLICYVMRKQIAF